MPDNGNGNQTTNLLRVWGWFWAVVVALIMTGLVAFNPDNAFGESECTSWLGFRFSTYPGQPAALQFLGTFIAAISAMMHLIERRRAGSFQIPTLILALVGALVIMAGQVLQGIREGFSVPAISVVLLTYSVLIWLLVTALIGVNRLYPWINRLYSWLKSRRESDG